MNHRGEASDIYRGIKWVENTLIQDETFSLLGYKALLKSGMEYKGIPVDATGSPIECSQKTKAVPLREEKRHT